MTNRAFALSLLVAGFLTGAAGAASAQQYRVLDGDSFVTPDNETIRIENIDTPSVGQRARCDIERETAARAIARVTQLLTECQPTIDKRFRDAGHRWESRVEVCGQDLGDLLMNEGLASQRNLPNDWCPAAAPAAQ